MENNKIKFRNMKLQLNNKLRYSLYVVLACVFITGCKTRGEYDDKIVKDAEGNYYHLEHNIGDSYFINPIKRADIDSLTAR